MLRHIIREPTFDISHVAGQEGTLQVIVYMDEVWMKVLAELLLSLNETQKKNLEYLDVVTTEWNSGTLTF